LRQQGSQAMHSSADELHFGSGTETAQYTPCGKEADQFAFRQAYGWEALRWVGEMPAILNRAKTPGAP
jgi:hypothetical protein